MATVSEFSDCRQCWQGNRHRELPVSMTQQNNVLNTTMYVYPLYGFGFCLSLCLRLLLLLQAVDVRLQNVGICLHTTVLSRLFYINVNFKQKKQSWQEKNCFKKYTKIMPLAVKYSYDSLAALGKVGHFWYHSQWTRRYIFIGARARGLTGEGCSPPDSGKTIIFREKAKFFEQKIAAKKWVFIKREKNGIH